MCALQAHHFCFRQRIPDSIATEYSEVQQFALLYVPHQSFLFTEPPVRVPGYEIHRGVGYYKIHSEPKAWYEARRICAKEGGHLAIINSEEESKVLQSILVPVATKPPALWLFIGFHDLYNEGQYLSVFGKESLLRCIEQMEYIMC
jgi:hypothetical protein